MEDITLITQIKMMSGISLSSDDIRVLTLLYQPIIGSQAVMLYLSMLHLLNRQKKYKELYPKTLVDLLDCTLEQFIIYKDKLEGIGLLTTYYKNSEYLFCLVSPLSVKEFLSDGILGEVLKRNLGDIEFNRLMETFVLESVDKKNYKEITKTFDQVFEKTEPNEALKIKGYVAEKRHKNTIRVNNSNFDYYKFIDLLVQKPEKWQQKRFMDQIIKIAYLYELNEEEFKNFIDDSGNFDFAELTKKAKIYSESKLINASENVKEDRQFTVIKNISTNSLLTHQLNRKPLVAELEAIDKLINMNLVSKEIINFFVSFILMKKNNELPGFSYLEAVAKDWRKKGITTTEQAYEYYLTEKQRKTKPKANNTFKSKTEEPDWLKKRMDDLYGKDSKPN